MNVVACAGVFMNGGDDSRVEAARQAMTCAEWMLSVGVASLVPVTRR